MEALQKFIFYVLPIIVLIILVVAYYSGGGLLEKTKNALAKTKEFLPKVTIGAHSTAAGTPTLPAPARDDLLAFKSAVEQLQAAAAVNCFLNYKGFSHFDEDTTLKLSYIPFEQKTVALISGSAGQQIPELSFTTTLKPCVVAGAETVTDGFYTNYLNPGTKQETIFTPVNTITITADGIDYGSGVQDFEGQRWLYKPDEQHLCFFPTVKLGTDEDGLDNDYFNDETAGDSLPYRVWHEDLSSCLSEFKAAEEVRPETSSTNLGEEPLPGGVSES